MRRLHTIFLTLIVLAIAASLITAFVRYVSTHKKVVCPSCNVILISIDTLGAKHTSVYDSSLETTPYLASLAARRGVVFESAYSQAPWTLPSHAAMFTGSYPWDIGIMEASDALPEGATTIAEVLTQDGYGTHMLSNGAFVNPLWNMTQGFDTFAGSLLEEDWNDLPGLFDLGITAITEHKQSSPDKPYFVFLRPFMVHDPYGDGISEPAIGIHDIVAANAMTQTSTSTEAERFRTAYRKEVRLTDTSLEAFMTELEKRGELERTIVIITADHGEEFGEHGTVGAHSVTVHRENIWVPLVFIIPGVKASRIPASVEIRSIPATIAELVGASTQTFEAASLLPLITGKETEDRVVMSQTALTRASFLENIERIYQTPDFFTRVMVPAERTSPVPNFTQSVIRGPWHLIRESQGTTTLLFDMPLDQEERINVLHRIEYYAPDVQQRIHTLVSLLITS
jgi:arylsulfatase A-like enzyme